MANAKNKTATPRLAFPFFLKTDVKQGRFQKKEEIRFYKPIIKE